MDAPVVAASNPDPPVRRASLLLLMIGCSGRDLPSTAPTADEPTRYRVGVVTGSGDRTTTDVYTLRVVPVDRSVWAFVTEAAEGTWEAGAAALSWSSQDPRPEDPWPIVMQHAVSSVPARIVLDDEGRPVRFADPDPWRRAARAAILDRELPEQALAASEALLDPDGVVRDLQRSFPGAPPVHEDWTREERIAGLVVVRRESCTVDERLRQRIYTCEGVIEDAQAEAQSQAAARIFASQSTTVLTLDRHGLVELDSRYSGTLVYVDATGERAQDRPIAGLRRVVRTSN